MNKKWSSFLVFGVVFLLAGCSSGGRGRSGGGNSNKGNEIRDVQQKKELVMNVATGTFNNLGADFKVDVSLKLSGSLSQHSTDPRANTRELVLNVNNVGLSAELLVNFPENIQSQTDIENIKASIHSKTTGSISGKYNGATLGYDCAGTLFDGYLYQNKVYFQIFDDPVFNLVSFIDPGLRIETGKFFVNQEIFQLGAGQIKVDQDYYGQAMEEIYMNVGEYIEADYLRIYESDNSYTFDLNYPIMDGMTLKSAFKIGKDNRPIDLTATLKIQYSEKNTYSSEYVNATLSASVKFSYLNNPTIQIPNDLWLYQAIN